MTESEMDKHINEWFYHVRTDLDIPDIVRPTYVSHMNELRRLLIEIHCPTLVAEARDWLEDACRTKSSTLNGLTP